MKFGLHAAVSIGSGIGRALGGRFRTGEKANRSTRVTVDRFDAVEDFVHAWATPGREGALAQAKARALEAKDGHIRGALHGVPMAVKDVIDVAGLPTRAYSPTRKNIAPALADAQHRGPLLRLLKRGL